MTLTMDFDHADATVKDLVGGKGANLGLLAKAGFDVPPGFCITTDAYVEFLQDSGLHSELAHRMSEFKYDDLDVLESQAAEVRDLITGAPMPGRVAAEITEAYRKLTDAPFVAVRSSGIFEDLSEASFAGMHDTHLDVKGEEVLLHSVRECWASMWSTRAIAYRHDNGIEHLEARMALVVQRMADSDVSGVMFTGNPITTATDEIVINSSWGLGESVVSGTVTPDSFVVKASNLRIVERTLGSKNIRVVRDRVKGQGTIVEEVPGAERGRYSLSDGQVAELAALGRRVQTYYEELPQDIEWAIVDGQIHLLQSRPITGVEFSWDADLDDVQIHPDDENWTWSRLWADRETTGAVSPLAYSTRFIMFCNELWPEYSRILGLEEISKIRAFKFHKAEIYYNSDWERVYNSVSSLPVLRPMILSEACTTPPTWRDEIMNSPFSYLKYLKMLTRISMLHPERAWTGAIKVFDDFRENRNHETQGLTDGELQGLSDKELTRYADGMIDLEREWVGKCIPGFYFYFRDTMLGLSWMVTSWYDGKNDTVLSDLLSGSRERTDTVKENHILWEFSQRIRHSAELTRLFEQHPGGEFFTAIEQRSNPEVANFYRDYQQFMTTHAHRGHTDRDLIYPRRSEDPSLDYENFKMFLSMENPIDPFEREAETDRRREEAYDEVIANFRRKPLGFVKVEIFKLLFDFVHKWITVRDNERFNPNDVVMMAYKRAFIEVGRRLHERGVLEGEQDFYFLGRNELYDLLLGRGTNLTLTRAKVAARRRDFERFYNKEVRPPMFLRANKAVDLSVAQEALGDGALRGNPNSSGITTATARVLKSRSELSRVQTGDIIVVNSTDPGWTPVFLVAGGIIAETGGYLSHASALAREYGLPALQLENAMDLIPDGATVTINGNTGDVHIADRR